MRFTIHKTPIVNNLMRFLARIFFKLTGWKAEGQRPDIPKYVIIAAPHTSNWDFLHAMCLAFIFKIEPLVMMKADWFRGPLGPFFKWLGIIPIDRSKSNNVVIRSTQAFHDNARLVMLIPPSGTRKKVMYWKTGFYYIAKSANVPIVLGYLDYRRKAGGIGPIFKPTGDIEADMKIIRNFYIDITGKYPQKASNSLALPEPKIL
ncbi:MAG: lysophospholipid acyltransferase family protein [Deltaproteobacteria bacterium]|nr:lysophospholipid acyltransferase family protein [Deltaproteobacteria bacterium]MBW2053189.1 lysophospholipid acyltransferase family protein [Deltaproteobacteria bacterium]MBW2141518.1 lysophospholipid acyltransferase family protein [Deltaproteobacteria bacterium]MBW2323234.1 lysophospholipid acyltransferase family protein [Deltaproteobacteria bacterium]